ncbi:metalloprotease PmbA [Thiococcus pfennigii]|uniref:metalloprotease PmbA n=1 Tax=Thiococcus pfennigii TaxID=1057 RepID=UPI001906FE39|nr:metalloprotease PmbA [Thiococcus pfennigii]MBK1700886.1 metalloprotease PmbA [Thiococcus pfennigii]MBK1732676.1 metalloprotease PmbA [Thiococcus pfennigii]
MAHFVLEDPQGRLGQLRDSVAAILTEAARQGATAAEAAVSTRAGLEVAVRLGEVETIEHTRDNGLGVTVYFGHRKGSASTSDLSPAALREAVAAACAIARYTEEDPYAALADAERMAGAIPDLDLYHPWAITAEDAIALAVACEDAARSHDPRITNSEGASLSSHWGLQVYGNSHGFIGGYPTTRHGLSCAVIGEADGGMQRDYWWSTARAPQDLEEAAAIGRRAAERTLARLGARPIATRQAPVLFQAEVAAGLLRQLIGAIQGASIYRRASFLLDRLGEPVFPSFVHIHERPLLPRGLASAPFDGDGVATADKDLVRDGILQTYVLDSYAARKLGMETTGNAGGVRNLAIDMGELDRPALLREMGTGLLVTELMGHGVNLVTGDYSRGAAGLWIEGGEVKHPVEEVTIAGNLAEMFAGLVAVGNDCDFPGSTRTGSWLIDRMTIAGT